MTNLLATLGLQNVAADPNDIPPNTYDGEVSDSKFVLMKEKDQFAHVITYKVTDGPHKGAQRPEFFILGHQPRNAQGQFPDKVEDITNYNQAMNDNNKMWYKKRWTDLGIPEADVNAGTIGPEVLKGRPVTFGVKVNAQGFKNVNYVTLRNSNGQAPAQQVGVPNLQQAMAAVQQPMVQQQAPGTPQVTAFDPNQPAQTQPQSNNPPW